MVYRSLWDMQNISDNLMENHIMTNIFLYCKFYTKERNMCGVPLFCFRKIVFAVCSSYIDQTYIKHCVRVYLHNNGPRQMEVCEQRKAQILNKKKDCGTRTLDFLMKVFVG
jgi:hypothetical protein